VVPGPGVGAEIRGGGRRDASRVDPRPDLLREMAIIRSKVTGEWVTLPHRSEPRPGHRGVPRLASVVEGWRAGRG